MAKRNQAPEEFIRDYIRRGFTREQILSRANKKDQGFYRLVSEILNHTTLIEKIERQVDGIQQSQINFEKHSYSSKTILDDIEKRKVSDKEIRIVAKPKDNGRSNLPIHTDLNMNDLEAPLPDMFKTKKIAFTISTNKKENNLPEREQSLFDEVQQDSNQESNRTTAEKKLSLYPLMQKETLPDETSKLPESKAEIILNQMKITNSPLTESKIEESNNYTDLEKEKLIAILRQKELLLTELNRNLGNKEATIQVDRKIAGERKTKQAEEIKDLKQKSSIYRMGLYIAAGTFVFTILIIKVASLNSNNSLNKINSNNLNLVDSNNKEEKNRRDKERNEFIKKIEDMNNSFADNSNNEEIPPPTHTPENLHLIKKGETFWKITGKYFGKENAHMYKKVMQFNGITNESAPVGKTIKIPSLAELEE